MPTQLTDQLTQRFFRYLAITSQSKAGTATLPSTPGQHEMAQLLASELRELAQFMGIARFQ